MWPSELLPRLDAQDEPLEARSEYVARIHELLPNFPPEVLGQWFFEHQQQIGEWAWLDYRRTRFALEQFPTADLPFETEDRSSLQEQYAQAFLAQPDLPRFARIADFIQAEGTWPVPPIVLRNVGGKLQYPNGWLCHRPFHLVEGHHRMAVLAVLRHQMSVQDRHSVWVIDVAV